MSIFASASYPSPTARPLCLPTRLQNSYPSPAAYQDGSTCPVILINKKICLDAWRSIPTNNEFITYGERTQGSFEAPLPVRFLSCKSPNHPSPSPSKCYFCSLTSRSQPTVSAPLISSTGRMSVEKLQGTLKSRPLRNTSWTCVYYAS